MGENKGFKLADVEELICTNHGGNPIRVDNFYMSSDVSIYKGIGRIPICKRCLYGMIDTYYQQTNDMRMTMYYMCRKIDIAFNSNIFESAESGHGKEPIKVFQQYMRQYNSLGDANNIHLPFDEGEHLMTGSVRDNSEAEDKEAKEDTGATETVDMFKDAKMNTEDIEIRDDIINILGSDPFQGYPESDQKFLYNDFINYLDDEDIHEDKYLISQIIQLVNNNNQIRKIDYLISQHTANIDLLVKNESKVKSLNSLKKDIVNNNDKIAKENRISVRNRKGGEVRKSAITVMMEYLRELEFEDAEIDFYDQKKAYGMQRVADISMKAISEQIQFDENDVNEIIIEQREMIHKMEHKILDLEEENRKLLVDIRNIEAIS